MGVSDAEGFGLSTLESLACGTPIITTMTGGLQEQVQKGFDINHENTLKRNRENKGIKLYDHGIGIEPSSKAIIGSQQVPYIYEDRINGDDVVEALMTMYELGKEGREKLGEAALKHISESYNFENFAKSWDEFITEIHEKNGSWENRKNYKSWEMIKV
jgi:glycosyltransferase involved in cell wall biosynthesis